MAIEFKLVDGGRIICENKPNSTMVERILIYYPIKGEKKELSRSLFPPDNFGAIMFSRWVKKVFKDNHFKLPKDLE